MMYRELFKDVMPIAESFAPIIASVIRSHSGAAFGYLVSVLARVFGGDAADINTIVSAMLEDPDLKRKLVQIEGDHATALDALSEGMHRVSSAKLHVELTFKDSK